jgi:hypothetical protein
MTEIQALVPAYLNISKQAYACHSIFVDQRKYLQDFDPPAPSCERSQLKPWDDMIFRITISLLSSKYKQFQYVDIVGL